MWRVRGKAGGSPTWLKGLNLNKIIQKWLGAAKVRGGTAFWLHQEHIKCYSWGTIQCLSVFSWRYENPANESRKRETYGEMNEGKGQCLAGGHPCRRTAKGHCLWYAGWYPVRMFLLWVRTGRFPQLHVLGKGGVAGVHNSFAPTPTLIVQIQAAKN